MQLKNISQINTEIAKLPIAVLEPVVVNGVERKQFKAVRVTNAENSFDTIAAITSDHYKLVQHHEAFKPVLEGLAMRNANYNFALVANHKKAWLNVFVGNGYDSVKYGFRVVNSFDRSTSIRYGLSAFTQTKILELVGYRQVCSNGMVVRVDLANAEFVKVEERTQIEHLLARKIAIRHQGDVNAKLEEVQFVVEAFLLLEKPLERIIKKAEKFEITLEKAEEFIKKYVGRRKLDKILTQFGKEDQPLWGLYNAVTFIASHTLADIPIKQNTLIEKAATMLERELTPVQV